MAGVLVLCERGFENRVLEEIENLGSFKSTGFKGVLIGEIADLEAFLNSLEGKPFIQVSRVVPYEDSFYFKPEKLSEILRDRVEKYTDRFETGKTFCVRMVRRGLKGKISSRDIEREIGGYIQTFLEEKGKEPKVNLEDPDKVIIIETLGNLCLIGLISKELRQKHPLVKSK